MQLGVLRGTIALAILFLPAVFAGCPTPGDPPNPHPANPHPGLDPSNNDGGPPTARMTHNLPLPHNTMTHNTLIYSSIMMEETVMKALTDGALNDLSRMPSRTFDKGTDGGQRSRTLMEYIVSCALDDGQPAKYRDPMDQMDPAETIEWSGELGLCGVNSPAGNWGTHSPTLQCLQLVSACLLARVNAYGLRVPLSLRGEPPGLFPLRNQVPVETRWRSTKLIESFDECDGVNGGAGQNCGWDGQYVGRCVAGEKVTVGLKNVTRVTAGNAALRVCSGIYGCNTDPIPLPKARYTCHQGAGFLCETAPGMTAPERCHDKNAPGDQLSVTFECPANGPRGYGYYSVMVPRLMDKTISVEGSGTNDNNHYPATEQEVFTYREGSFYGNLFQWENNGKFTDGSYTGFPYSDAFACWSDIWTAGLAYMSNRVCANPPDSICGNAHARQCEAKDDDDDDGDEDAAADEEHFFDTEQDYACQRGYGNDGGPYGHCKGSLTDRNFWDLPITVYLNGPCDLSGVDDLGCEEDLPEICRPR